VSANRYSAALALPDGPGVEQGFDSMQTITLFRTFGFVRLFIRFRV